MGKGKLHTRQEVEVRFILPAVRKAMAQKMKDKGLSQKEIARRLNVTEPAVSQWLQGKRANSVNFDESIHSAIEEAADKVENHHQAREQTQCLLKVIKAQGATCKLCKEVTAASDDCNICLE